jgi:hypothetical protein
MQPETLALSRCALKVVIRFARRMACHIVTTTLLAAAIPAMAAPDETPMDVGMVQLLGTPEKYDGMLIRVVGFLSLEFEGIGLYCTARTFRMGRVTGSGSIYPRKPIRILAGITSRS